MFARFIQILKIQYTEELLKLYIITYISTNNSQEGGIFQQFRHFPADNRKDIVVIIQISTLMRESVENP